MGQTFRDYAKNRNYFDLVFAEAVSHDVRHCGKFTTFQHSVLVAVTHVEHASVASHLFLAENFSCCHNVALIAVKYYLKNATNIQGYVGFR